MTLKQNSIFLDENPLFSLFELKTPLEEALPIPSAACFCYVIDGDQQVIDERSGLVAKKGNVILALCGFTLSNMFAHQEAGRIKMMIVHFIPDHLKAAFQDSKPPNWKELDSPVSKYFTQIAADNLITSYVNGILQLFENENAVNDELLLIKLRELFVLLLQTDRSHDIVAMVRSLFSERTFSFKEIVEAHIFEPVSVGDLAELTNTSLSTFKREFKKIYKDSPASYILKRRTKEAANKLVYSDIPISQIAYDAGFSAPSHLTRCFKEQYGVSPTEYRLSLSDK